MLQPLYSVAKLSIPIISAVATGGAYLATESVISENSLVPLGVAILVATFIASVAFKWGGRIARLEDRIASLEGKRDGDGYRPGKPFK